jgi:VWFA-related protein
MRKSSCLVLAVVCGGAMMASGQNSQPAGSLPAQSPSQSAPAWPGSSPAANPSPSASPLPPASPLPAPPAPAATTDDGRIHLDVVVTDKKGNLIKGLTEKDFTLLDNRDARKIDSFEALGGSDPQGDSVQVVLAIDAVNIGFDRVAVSRQYISEFLRRDNGRLPHPVSIVWVTDVGLQQQLGPSMDGNALAAQLDGTAGQLRMLNRSAGAWGAIERFEMSGQMLDQLVSAMGRFPGRKLLVWIGPGWPMLDDPNMQMSWKQQQRMFQNMVYLSTKVRKAQIEICSVAEGMPNFETYEFESFLKGVKKPGQMNLPNLSLKVLAIWSGGQVRLPTNDLASEIARCVKDAGAYYRISFTPPRADGPNEYHELQVKVDRPGVTARTSKMYYNQPPTQDAGAATGH